MIVRPGSILTFAALTWLWVSLCRAMPPALADTAKAGELNSSQTKSGEKDPPEVAIGERLFLETRFAQFFYANCDGDVNRPLPGGDPGMERAVTLGQPAAGPFAGKSMNCRACHLVDELKDAGLGNRAYADFARRSPIPARNDGRAFTPRNSPPLVNALAGPPEQSFLHFDAEFGTPEDLVKGTLTGRNYGWLPDEQPTAVAHIAKVIREDDGTGELAKEFGGAYGVVLKGTDPALSKDFRLPAEFRLDVSRANDAEIMHAIARLVTAYLRSLEFEKDENGLYTGSPFDVFLAKNKLPRNPGGTSDLEFSRRLLKAVEALKAPQFVSNADRQFKLHAQEFKFGPDELAGMKIFFTEKAASTGRSAGNCIACHAAPHFTDFQFHNTGAAQDEYDAVHGAGAFARLQFPSQAERLARAGEFLPPSARHPRATGRFINASSADKPGHVDLGLWNVFGNPAVPGPQERLLRLLRADCGERSATVDQLLPRTVAMFKTPGLRDLGHSAPYLHTGRADTLEDVLMFYARASHLAREGRLVNGAPELKQMSLGNQDIPPLAAFLRSLNEDYE